MLLEPFLVIILKVQISENPAEGRMTVTFTALYMALLDCRAHLSIQGAIASLRPERNLNAHLLDPAP